MVFSDEKIDIIFVRLLNYMERNFKSFVCRESILNIKLILKEILEDKNKISEFEKIGYNFAESNILFVESIHLFDFLRKNFIAHLPNNIDLREAKRFERLFEDIINIFSKGYLKSYSKRKIDNLTFIQNHTIPTDMINQLSEPLKNHIQYFKTFLETLIDEKDFINVSHDDCEFGKWLKLEGKEFVEEDLIYKNLKLLHKNFHNLIEISKSYKEKKLYKEIFFTINEVENAVLQIMNTFAYLNTRILSYEFSKDPLTGALTRRGFNKIIQKHFEIAELTGLPMSVIIADIDFFKKINDTYGHLAGDEALKHFVRIVKNNLRKSDYIFRFGGEEFLILLPNTSLKEAVEVAERTRKSLENDPLTYEGKEIKITASFGVKEVSPNEPIDKIIKEADEKLYKAKESGRNRVIF
jgi:diguanylate cyclase (GGDEF)-like protein